MAGFVLTRRDSSFVGAKPKLASGVARMSSRASFHARVIFLFITLNLGSCCTFLVHI